MGDTIDEPAGDSVPVRAIRRARHAPWIQGVPALAAFPHPPDVPRWIGLVALAAGLLLAFGGVRRRRRGRGQGLALLMLAPAALVVGVYLLLAAGGPRDPRAATGAPPVTPAPTSRPATLPPAVAAPGTVRVVTPDKGGVTALPPLGQGRLIYVRDDGFWALGLADGRATNLPLDLPRNVYASEPALSTGGGTIAFAVDVVVTPATPTSSPRPAPRESTIWLVDAVGGHARPLLAHTQPDSLIQALAWSRDDATLTYAYTAPILGADGRYVGAVNELQRLDVATGARTTLVREGRDPAVSTAGDAALAYVTDTPGASAPVLWLADPDGHDARQLVGPAARFQAIARPRFSPDGRTIIFAGSGGPTAGGATTPARAPTRGVVARFARWLVAPLVPAAAAAHGQPAELWAVDRASGALHRLTTLNLDDPVPAWSPDGGHIASMTGSGLYIVTADGGGPVRIARYGYSTVLWAAR